MQILDSIETIGSPIRNMIISVDDTFIIVSCEDNTVQIKSLVTGSDVHHLEGHTSDVTSLGVSADAICCYVACRNSHIYVYNLRSRELLKTLTHHESSVNDLCLSNDGCFLFSASEVSRSISSSSFKSVMIKSILEFDTCPQRKTTIQFDTE